MEEWGAADIERGFDFDKIILSIENQLKFNIEFFGRIKLNHP